MPKFISLSTFAVTLIALVLSGCQKEADQTGVVQAILRNAITGERYSGITVTCLKSFENLGYGGIGGDQVTDGSGVATFRMKLKKGHKYDLHFEFNQMISVDECSYEWYADGPIKLHVFNIHPLGYTNIKVLNHTDDPSGDTVWVRYRHELSTEFYPERIANYGNWSGGFLDYLDVGNNIFEFRMKTPQGDSVFTKYQNITEGYTPLNKVTVDLY